MRFHFLPILALPIAITGCINTDAAVFVEPTIENPTAVVSGGALGVTIAGHFTLKLHLGARASDPSTVELRDFKIRDFNGRQTWAAIEISKSSTMFPATVDLDSDVSSELDFDLGTKTLPSADEAELCITGGIRIGGTIQDSLLATDTPFTSPVFHPTGCP
jgi:hypothetical protein